MSKKPTIIRVQHLTAPPLDPKTDKGGSSKNSPVVKGAVGGAAGVLAAIAWIVLASVSIILR